MAFLAFCAPVNVINLAGVSSNILLFDVSAYTAAQQLLAYKNGEKIAPRPTMAADEDTHSTPTFCYLFYFKNKQYCIPYN